MSPRMIQEGRVLLIPKMSDLNNAVDITDYVTSDGVWFTQTDGLAHEMKRIAHSASATVEGLHQLAEALNAKAWEAPNATRQMNTNKQYPTSTPPWGRRKR